MLILILGSEYSGKSTLSTILIQEFQFNQIPPDITSSNQIQDFLLSNENWKLNWTFTKSLPCIEIAQLKRRPFTLIVSIDAPALTRFSRSGLDNLLEFLSNDESSFESVNESKLLSHISILNNSTIQNLREKVLNLNLLDSTRLRPDWDTYFLNISVWASQRSNCMKRRVGCIIVKDFKIVSTGYNGVPRGLLNCNDGGCFRCNSGSKSNERLEECLCLHGFSIVTPAEENALLEAGRDRVCGGELYCTSCPCLGCAKKIVQ